jgi:hypothetical protein
MAFASVCYWRESSDEHVFQDRPLSSQSVLGQEKVRSAVAELLYELFRLVTFVAGHGPERLKHRRSTIGTVYHIPLTVPIPSVLRAKIQAGKRWEFLLDSFVFVLRKKAAPLLAKMSVELFSEIYSLAFL